MKRIKYSEQAYKDGYDFSSLTEEEQEMTIDYYSSKEEIREVVNLAKAAKSYIRNNGFDNTQKALIDYDWRFFKDGEYNGIIVNCSKSKKTGSKDYILELMIDEYTIKYIKFNPFYYKNPVTYSILGELDFDENYYRLIGRYVSFSVCNITYSGKTFAKISEFEFIEKSIIDLHIKMYDIINETCLKRRREAKRI